MSRQITVAVTGMNALPDNPGPGLAVARCLREADGFSGRIVGLSYDALDPGLYVEQYCDANYLLPYPSAGDQVFLERLRTIQATEKIDVLIPCLDAELPSMVKLTGVLREMGIHTLLPTPDQLSMRTKDKLTSIAKRAGIASPDTKSITNPRFFHTCQDEGWSYPFVVKGIFYGAQTVYSAEQAETIFRKFAQEWGYPILVQRLVKGEEYNLTAVGDGKGNMLHAVMMKKMSVTDKGKAWAGVSVYDQTLYNASTELVDLLKWRGPLEIEVMRDTSGQYQLIEINPRFPAWVYLSVGVGSNLPKILLDLILGDAIVSTTQTKTGILYLRHAADMVRPISAFENFVVNGGSC